MFELVFLFSICAKLYSQRAKKRNIFHRALPGASPATASQENNPWAWADKAVHKDHAEERPLSPTSAQGNRIYLGRMELTALGSCQGPEEQIKSPFLYPKKGCSALAGVCSVPAVFALGCWAGEKAWKETKSRQ